MYIGIDQHLKSPTAFVGYDPENKAIVFMREREVMLLDFQEYYADILREFSDTEGVVIHPVPQYREFMFSTHGFLILPPGRQAEEAPRLLLNDIIDDLNITDEQRHVIGSNDGLFTALALAVWYSRNRAQGISFV